MSYFLWQLKCHYGLENRHIWLSFFATLDGCDSHHIELSSLTCEGWQHCIICTPAQTCYPHMAFNCWTCHKCWQERYQPLQPDLCSFQNYWCFARAFYICLVFSDGSKIVASCHSQYSFDSCCCCCCFHKPSEWIMKRMWLFFTSVLNQTFRNAGNKLYNVRVHEKIVNWGLCVTVLWTCSNCALQLYEYTESNITHLWTQLLLKHKLFYIWLKISL